MNPFLPRIFFLNLLRIVFFIFSPLSKCILLRTKCTAFYSNFFFCLFINFIVFLRAENPSLVAFLQLLYTRSIPGPIYHSISKPDISQSIKLTPYPFMPPDGRTRIYVRVDYTLSTHLSCVDQPAYYYIAA